MKILQVNKLYAPDIGGMESVIKQYSEFLKDQNDVIVLCVHKNFTLKTTNEIINGVKVVRASSFGTFFSMPVSISFFYHFFRLSSKIDIFHFHEPFPLGAIASIFLPKNKKIIITWHGEIVKQKFFKSFMDIFQKKICKKANLIITTSPNLLNNSPILSKFRDKVTILPLSIPFNEIKNESKNNDSILYLGRLSYYKGIEVLIDAFELTKTEKKLVIVGDGDISIVNRINEHLRTTKKNIQFIHKFVSENEKLQYIKDCCFFVFPSIQSGEAFGIIQLEVMLQKKAIINTNLPTGVPFVSLDKVTGITVEPKNIQELSIAIDNLSSNEKLTKEMGERAYERVKNNFSDNIVFPKLLKLYQNI